MVILVVNTSPPFGVLYPLLSIIKHIGCISNYFYKGWRIQVVSSTIGHASRNSRLETGSNNWWAFMYTTKRCNNFLIECNPNKYSLETPLLGRD